MISPRLFLERTTAHTNIDEKLIFPEIKAAQDVHIRPLLGSVLYVKILNDIATDSLAGVYLYIWEEFLVDALINYVLSEMPETLNQQFWNKGVATKNADQSTSPSLSDLYTVVSRYKKRAEHYANACRLYIVENVTDYPEYYAAGGIDRVLPSRGTFTSPIYLGDTDSTCLGRANHNPNINSNDVYYS